MNSNRLEIWFFGACLFGVIVLSYRIIEPYIGALVLGVTFAIIFKPVYERLRERLKSAGLAAAATIVLVVVLVFTPLTLIAYEIFQQATEIYADLASGNDTLTSHISGLVEGTLQRYGIPPSSVNVNEYARQALGWLLGNLGPLFSGIAQVALTVFLGLFGLYYFLRDGDEFRRQVVDLIPLENEYAEKILDKMSRAVNSVVKGTLVVAMIQGLVAGVGFTIFGVPHPAFWGSVAAFAALVPTLGTSLILIPSVLFLLFTGHMYAAVGLLIWGFFAVGLIDNMLAPYLVRRGTQIHSFFILLGVLGGVNLFGPIGILMGPLVIALFFALIDLYKVLILKEESRA
jgi:predicted PurR-regulated permease PerM